MIVCFLLFLRFRFIRLFFIELSEGKMGGKWVKWLYVILPFFLNCAFSRTTILPVKKGLFFPPSHLLCFIESYRSDENSCERHWHHFKQLYWPTQTDLFSVDFSSVLPKTISASWVREISFMIEITPKWILRTLCGDFYLRWCWAASFFPLRDWNIEFFSHPPDIFSPLENTVSNEINKTAIKIAETRTRKQKFFEWSAKKIESKYNNWDVQSENFHSQPPFRERYIPKYIVRPLKALPYLSAM